MLTEAGKFRKSVTNQMWRLMSRFDYLLPPTTNDLPPPADKPDGADDFVRPLPVFTCIANMTGQPAASIPAGSTASDLPIGIQIFGRHSPIATYWRSPPRSSGRVRGGNTGRDHDGACSGVMRGWLESFVGQDASADVAGHKIPDNDDSPRIVEETRQYIRDSIRLNDATKFARELYDRILKLYPDRANPGSLWSSAAAAKAET